MFKGTVIKKTKVIEAAVSVFADKGFSASTISDLARKAEVGEATIYNNFKNKMEILLNLPIPYIEDFIAGCDEQLKGIKDPEEKVRKYIWQTLRWSQQHRNCIKVLLNDVVPTPQYYHSRAYELMQEALQILLDFLDEGKTQGVFRKDIDSRKFGVFLFGTISYMLLVKIMLDSSFELLEEFDELASTLIAAIKKNDTGYKVEIHKLKDRRERILLAAEKLFSQKMFDETTISEIAQVAHVADGTIYDYFENKEALLFKIFNERMQDFMGTYNEMISPKDARVKLKLAVFHFLSWMQDNPSWTRVYIKDIATNPRFFLSDEHLVKLRHDEKLLGIYSQGEDQGVFRTMNADIFLALFFGPIYFTSLPWALLNQGGSLIAELDDLFDFLFRAVSSRKATPVPDSPLPV